MARINLGRLRKFVLSRQNDDDGFAFCKPLPSSLPETYYAVFVLKTIGEKIPKREKLVRFLRENLREEPYSIFWVLNTLSLLEEDLPDMSSFLLKNLEKVSIPRKRLSSERGITATYSFEMPNLLRWLYLHTISLQLLGIEIPEEVKSFLKKFRKNGGFGINNPNLQETYYCVSILREIENKREVISFILSHECRTGGFASAPKGYPPYVEETYYALSCFRILNYAYYNEKTMRYLISLQNSDGGFRRSIYLGISTLGDTYYAIASLKYLDEIK